MNTSDRGTKHVCPDCQCKYYDLRNEVVACPKCGAKPLAEKSRKAAQPSKDVGRRKLWHYP